MKLRSRVQNELVKRLRRGDEIQTMQVHHTTWQTLAQRGVIRICPDTCLLSLTEAWRLSPHERRSQEIPHDQAA